MKLDLDRTPFGSSSLIVDGKLELGGGEILPAFVHVQGELGLQNLESRVLVTGRLLAGGEVACSRCLEDFHLDWDLDVNCMVLRDVLSQEGRDDSMVVHQRDGEADLTEIFRESVILSLPQAPLCSPECRGLCAGCGNNLNLAACSCEAEAHDPRWDALP